VRKLRILKCVALNPVPDFDVIQEKHAHEIWLRKDKRGVDLISDARPFGRLWYGEPNAISNAAGYAKFRSRSHDAVIRVYDAVPRTICVSSSTAPHCSLIESFE